MIVSTTPTSRVAGSRATLLVRRPIRGAASALLLVLAAAAVGAIACRDNVIVDSWGPPAGYALVTGSVRTAAGRTVANAEVMLSRCASPIGGYLGSGVTDAQGFFQVRANLPPIGLLPVRADTLQIRCYVFVDRASTPNDSLDVHFSADLQAPAVQTLNLTVP